MQLIPLNENGEVEILDGEATEGEKRLCKFKFSYLFR